MQRLTTIPHDFQLPLIVLLATHQDTASPDVGRLLGRSPVSAASKTDIANLS